MRKSTARARVQLRRVERDQTTLRDTLAAEDEAMSAWLRRAETTVCASSLNEET
ncbi:MAG: hypothetical protein JRH14_22755 [Deltaproteobacteria bacterium]|nr:hypothetical protein [Deltaproteobacteria bacterium]